MHEKLLSLTLPGGPTIVPPEGIPDGGNIGSLASLVIIVLGAVAVIAALIFLLIGAIKWILSGGDKEKLENARRTVIYAIIGLVIVLLSGVFIVFIQRLLVG